MPGTVWSTGTTQLGQLGFRKYVLPQWRYRVQWRRTSEAQRQPFELCGHVNWDVWSVELWTTHTSSTSKLNFLLVETTQVSKQAQITLFIHMHFFRLFQYFCRRLLPVYTG